MGEQKLPFQEIKRQRLDCHICSLSTKGLQLKFYHRAMCPGFGLEKSYCLRTLDEIKRANDNKFNDSGFYSFIGSEILLDMKDSMNNFARKM